MRKLKNKDYYEEDIMKVILESGEQDEVERPIELFTDTLKNYVKDIKSLQNKDKAVNEN